MVCPGPAGLQVMSERFPDPGLVELVGFISLLWAGGRFGKAPGLRSQQAAESGR